VRSAAWLLFAACGRIGFDGVADDAAPEPDTGDAAAVVLPEIKNVQTGMDGPADVTMFGIPSTREGSLLILATVSFEIGGTGALVSSISSDVGDSFVSVGQVANWTGDDGRTEIWYAPDGKGGATQLTIQSEAVTQRELWFLEVANMDPVPLDAAMAISDHPSDPMPGAPAITPTRRPALVVSIMQISGFLTEDGIASPFIALPVVNGDDAAYAIVTEPGAFGARWTAPGTDNYAAITAAFFVKP
jgi:hypothetical protein